MTNPPNQPRDDRRLHEGDKKGLGGTTNKASQEDVTPDRTRESEESSTTDREQESALGGDVATRSKV